jgi:hypothetical protein
MRHTKVDALKCTEPRAKRQCTEVSVQRPGNWGQVYSGQCTKSRVQRPGYGGQCTEVKGTVASTVHLGQVQEQENVYVKYLNMHRRLLVDQVLKSAGRETSVQNPMCVDTSVCRA